MLRLRREGEPDQVPAVIDRKWFLVELWDERLMLASCALLLLLLRVDLSQVNFKCTEVLILLLTNFLGFSVAFDVSVGLRDRNVGHHCTMSHAVQGRSQLVSARTVLLLPGDSFWLRATSIDGFFDVFKLGPGGQGRLS